MARGKNESEGWLFTNLVIHDVHCLTSFFSVAALVCGIKIYDKVSKSCHSSCDKHVGIFKGPSTGAHCGQNCTATPVQLGPAATDPPCDGERQLWRWPEQERLHQLVGVLSWKRARIT
jgi:hypothetical protein